MIYVYAVIVLTFGFAVTWQLMLLIMRTPWTRVYKAFVSGFWEAWRATTPRKYAGTLVIKVECDSTEAQAQLSKIIHDLDEIRNKQHIMSVERQALEVPLGCERLR